VRIAAEVKHGPPPAAAHPAKLWRQAARHQRFALTAAEEALRDAGVRPSEADAERWGCVLAGGMMGADYDELRELQQLCAPGGTLEHEKLLRHARALGGPRAFVRGLPNAAVCLLAECYGVRGYTAAVHTACSSGGQALGLAMRIVRRGTADRVLAGGCDSMINPLWLGAFCLLEALSPDNHAPERASRPFDRTRNGFVLGEGAAVLVLEEWQAARARGARIYAELAGDGNSLSAYRVTDSHPSGDGAIQALRRALRDANLPAAAVDYVNAHGTSTPMNDRSECAALRAICGTHAPLVSSTKGQIGHLISAAGAVEAAFSALALFHSTVPGNVNLRERDPECDANLAQATACRRELNVALSSSFGFGGSNNCLVLRRAET